MPISLAITSKTLFKDTHGGSYTPITGTVVNGDAIPLYSAPVGLFRRATGTSSWTSVATTATDSAGAFSFTLPAGLAAGEYDYVAASSGDVSEIIRQWVDNGTYIFRNGGLASLPVGTLPYGGATTSDDGLPARSLTYVTGHDANGLAGRMSVYLLGDFRRLSVF